MVFILIKFKTSVRYIKGVNGFMKEWGTWLKRSTLVVLGAVLIGSSAGISALAANTSEPEKPTESTEPADNGTGNEDSSASKTDTTLIITNFATLDQDVRLQELEEGEEPNLPDKLDVTVAIKENKEGEESTTTGAGISNVVQAVGEIVQLTIFILQSYTLLPIPS